MLETYVVVSPSGLMYVGLHSSERDTWTIYLGWPTDEDIQTYLDQGWYCTKANITWQRPEKTVK